ncbi:MAG: DNA gyrase inhibitor YacG [Nitrospirota bacterium]|nr:DNA gyrase inhibitor YacG [Nitrospirota bacterium]
MMRITCPICKKITTLEENPWRPFCSKRCKLLDFGAWISGDYRIEGNEDEEEDERRDNEDI